jgi:ABC-2 type transport system ATP-binding protein
MIEAHELTKRYGEETAVDGIRFTIAPGSVTGFLGPNVAARTPCLPPAVSSPRRPACSSSPPTARHRRLRLVIAAYGLGPLLAGAVVLRRRDA